MTLQALVLVFLPGDLVIDGLHRVGVLGGEDVDELGALVVHGLAQLVGLRREIRRRLAADGLQIRRQRLHGGLDIAAALRDTPLRPTQLGADGVGPHRR